MKKFKIDNFTVKAIDPMNWKITERVKNDMTKKRTKHEYRNELVGYFATLEQVAYELSERGAKRSKTMAELENWVAKIKSVIQ